MIQHGSDTNNPCSYSCHSSNLVIRCIYEKRVSINIILDLSILCVIILIMMTSYIVNTYVHLCISPQQSITISFLKQCKTRRTIQALSSSVNRRKHIKVLVILFWMISQTMAAASVNIFPKL